MLSDGVNTYTYDAENRITTFSNTAGSSATYVYDAFGERVQKTTPSTVNNECNGAPNSGGPVYHLHDLSGNVSIYSSNGNNQCKYEVFAGTRHLAEHANLVYFIHSDWWARSVYDTVSAPIPATRAVPAVPSAKICSAPTQFTTARCTSPANNATPNPVTTTSAQDTTQAQREGSCRRIHLQLGSSSLIRNHGIWESVQLRP